MVRKLAHLCLRTNRFDEMTHFYSNLLGLPIQFELKLNDGTVFGRYFALGDTSFLEVFDEVGACTMWGGQAVTRSSNGTDRYQHFCLEVTELATYRTRIVQAGCSATEIALGMDGSRQCWIKDPDGNDIELMEYTANSLQLKMN